MTISKSSENFEMCRIDAEGVVVLGAGVPSSLVYLRRAVMNSTVLVANVVIAISAASTEIKTAVLSMFENSA